MPDSPPTATAHARHAHQRELEWEGERHVHEPHRVGLPPLVPYAETLWQRREFATELSRTSLRAQNFNTAFGQLWLLINPLLLAGVYFVLVDILRGGGRGPDFLAHLVGGLFAYQLVQHSLQQGVKSVTSGGKLILNTAFPRVLLPLSAVLTAFKRFLPTMGVYAVLHLALGMPLGPHLLWLVPLTALLLLLASGMTMLVSAGQVYFRDLSNFLPYGLRVWLYASPILYYADEIPERYEFLLFVNPIAPMLAAWSDVLSRGHAPDAVELAVGLAWGLLFFVAGALFFMSREREFAVRI